MGLMRATLIAFYLSKMAFGHRTEGPDEQQITSQLDAFHKRYHNRNPEAVYHQIYDPEAYILPHGESAMKGKANILSKLVREIGDMKELYFQNKKIGMFGNIAVEVCGYYLAKDEATREILEAGKCIIIWKMEQGTNQWKFLYNNWNEN